MSGNDGMRVGIVKSERNKRNVGRTLYTNSEIFDELKRFKIFSPSRFFYIRSS